MLMWTLSRGSNSRPRNHLRLFKFGNNIEDCECWGIMELAFIHQNHKDKKNKRHFWSQTVKCDREWDKVIFTAANDQIVSFDVNQQTGKLRVRHRQEAWINDFLAAFSIPASLFPDNLWTMRTFSILPHKKVLYF